MWIAGEREFYSPRLIFLSWDRDTSVQRCCPVPINHPGSRCLPSFETFRVAVTRRRRGQPLEKTGRMECTACGWRKFQFVVTTTRTLCCTCTGNRLFQGLFHYSQDTMAFFPLARRTNWIRSNNGLNPRVELIFFLFPLSTRQLGNTWRTYPWKIPRTT